MEIINEGEILEKLIKDNEMVLIYFSSASCGVCGVIKPKVEELLNEYTEVKGVQIDVEKSTKISAAYNIFTIPAIIVFIQGKETIREARYINIQDINNKIARYYNLLYYKKIKQMLK